MLNPYTVYIRDEVISFTGATTPYDQPSVPSIGL